MKIRLFDATLLYGADRKRTASRQLNMKKLTFAFCVRAYRWEVLHERGKLTKEEGCVNFEEGIVSEDIIEGKEDHKGDDLDNHIRMEDGQIVS